MIPGRRSHDVRPMTPTVVPSERRPSASEDASRPSLQNLIHSSSEGANGRAESACHSVGDAVSRKLAFLGVGDPRSSSTTSFLPPRSHSRLDSNSNRDVPSNMSSSTLVSVTKQHVSPSKVRVDLLATFYHLFSFRVLGELRHLIQPHITNCVVPSDTSIVHPDAAF
jgi:hypothetical protein